MPWSASEAKGHTRKADTPEKQKKWAKIANAALRTYKGEEGADGKAIATANKAMGDAFWHDGMFDRDAWDARDRKVVDAPPPIVVLGPPSPVVIPDIPDCLDRRTKHDSNQGIRLYDAISLDDAARVKFLKDGYMSAFPRIARTGVQLYRGSECGKNDMDVVRVMRPASEVFAAAARKTYTGLPVTLGHPKDAVTADNWKQHSVGETGEDVLRDGQSVRVPMMLRDAEAIKAYKDGKRQLSVGYDCDLEWKSGKTADGEEYDAIQRNIRANHLAVVAAARGGPDLTIGDDNEGDKPMADNLRSVTVDGIEVQMTDTAAAIVQKTLRDMQVKLTDAVTQRDEFKKKFEKAEEDKDDAEEEKEDTSKKCDEAIKAKDEQIKAKDAEIVALKQQVTDSKLTPAQIDAMVNDRNDVIGKAKTLLGDKLVVKDRTTAEIKKQVVDAKLGSKAASFGDGEINAAFMSFTDNLTAIGGGRTLNDAANAFSRPHSVSMQDEKEKAYAEIEARDADAWKNLGKTA